ncbi:DNA-processing protein DprA [Kamptonema cortianum]|nr:DNA-processing protein DprA [Geitlerinema splendidum]MDK3157718.1 DNA-processing protein DprA [Kamptonema cortianum]
MNPRFWQAFLAADLDANKSREFLANLGTFPDPLAAFISWPHLSAGHRRRIELAPMERFEKALKAGVEILEPPQFPPPLCDSDWHTPALFAWGNLDCLQQPKIGIVGTRSCTTYGKAAARKFAEFLAKNGVTVISGGALGIDAAAHDGALDADGSTVAVLGHGIDHVYPTSHGPLFKRIREKGCLLSQFAVGMPSMRENFLKRNQLIAALSDALLVVEAPQRSGALSTATAAADLGREVFVVPGNITQFSFQGSHRLIREGACLVDHPDQIFEAMGWAMKESDAAKPQPVGSAASLLSHLTVQSISVEKLAIETGLDPADLLADLTMLEIDGLVVRDSIGYALRP